MRIRRCVRRRSFRVSKTRPRGMRLGCPRSGDRSGPVARSSPSWRSPGWSCSPGRRFVSRSRDTSASRSTMRATSCSLERALSIDVEASVIDRVSGSDVEPALAWIYRNVHLPVLFAFLAAVRLSRPAQYPFVRTVFVLSFVPALLVIWLFPLAPPRWLSQLGLGPAPTDAELGEQRCPLPQRDRRGGEPALRLRALRRSGCAVAVPAVERRPGGGGLPGARLPRHRGDGQPLRPRLRRRIPDVRARGGRGARPPRPRCPTTRASPSRGQASPQRATG